MRKDDFGRTQVQIVLQQQHLLEADIHDVAAAHHEQNAKCGQNAGNVHIPNSLNQTGAVHNRRLMQLVGIAGQRSDVDD